MEKAYILTGSTDKEDYCDPSHGALSNSHWLPWIQHQLLIKDILAQTPEWPKPYGPKYEEWLEFFKQFSIDENTLLIAHSSGGGFLIRWLSENDVRVGKVILVAPWLDPDKTYDNFFDFQIDKDIVSKTKGIVIFNSDNDDEDVQKSVKLIRENVKDIQYREFHGYGHFIYRFMKTKEFPELLEEALKK